MGRIYSVEFENVTVSGIVDWFELRPADDKPIKILAIFLSQSTETGDAAEEMLRFQLIRGHTSTGSGGATPTPRPMNPSDTAAGFSAETNNTTIASAGTVHNLHSEAFNVRVGFQLIPTPKMEAVARQGDVTIVARLIAAPGDPVDMSGTIYVEELG